MWCWPSDSALHIRLESRSTRFANLQSKVREGETSQSVTIVGLNFVETGSTLPRAPEGRHRSQCQPVVTCSWFSFPTTRFSPVVRLVLYTRGGGEAHHRGPRARCGAYRVLLQRTILPVRCVLTSDLEIIDDSHLMQPVV